LGVFKNVKNKKFVFIFDMAKKGKIERERDVQKLNKKYFKNRVQCKKRIPSQRISEGTTNNSQ
jgi:hypothetical protein